MFVLFLALSACKPEPIVADETSADDLGGVLASNADLDNNGYADTEQTYVVAGTEDFGAVLFIEPGPQLPGGMADGQALETRGFGNEEYSSSDNGWEDGFLPWSPIYDADTGALSWYGIGGLRDGVYEIVCADVSAGIGTLDGWCLPGVNAVEADERDFVILVQDGSEGCYRQSRHFAFEVSGSSVWPLNDSIAPRDTTCY